MSAGATPSDLMRGTSAFAALALAAMASPAVFPVVVTPRATRAKSGGALTLPSPVTSTQWSWPDIDQAIERRGWRGGRERCQDCDESESAPHGLPFWWKRAWKRVRAGRLSDPAHAIGRLRVRMCLAASGPILRLPRSPILHPRSWGARPARPARPALRWFVEGRRRAVARWRWTCHRARRGSYQGLWTVGGARAE